MRVRACLFAASNGPTAVHLTGTKITVRVRASVLRVHALPHPPPPATARHALVRTAAAGGDRRLRDSQAHLQGKAEAPDLNTKH